MARYILVATLLSTLELKYIPDDQKALFTAFKDRYLEIPEGDEGAGNDAVTNLKHTQVDGANGGGGDSGADPLPFRISETKFTSQRFAVTPLSPTGGALTGTLVRAIKYPLNMRSELCLIFDNLELYRQHMNTYLTLYNSIFGYVTLIRESTTKS